jgi:hypothetical protein
VGPVPSSEPYGDRHPYGSVARKRQKHQDEQDHREQEEPADTFETRPAEEDSSATDGEPVEDYYLPAERPVESEE